MGRIRTKAIKKWFGYNFEPEECRTGKEFSAFGRNLKSELTAQLKDNGCIITKYIRGYFYVSGFIYNVSTGKYVYFCTDDVRYSPNWHKDILIREARNDHDYKGGHNQYTSLENFGEKALKLLNSNNFMSVA